MLEIDPNQVAKVAEALIDVGRDQPHEVYVGALLYVIRSCGDAFPCCRAAIAQAMLHLGGQMVATDLRIDKAIVPTMPATTSIH